MMKIFVQFTLFLLVGVCLTEDNYLNYESKLRDFLFFSKRIHTDARPVANFSHPVNVTVKFFPQFILDVDETKEIVKMYGWTYFVWMDEHLRWDPKNFGQIKSLHFPDYLIWKPDVVPYNSGDARNIAVYEPCLAEVSNDGMVQWVPPSNFEVICPLDFKFYPFDYHECEIKLGSWTHSGDDINLQSVNETEMDMTDFVRHREWKILSTSIETTVKYYNCCSEPYQSIQIHFTISRRASFYNFIVLLPATMLMLMILSTFWLPPPANEKLIIGGFTTICLLLLLAHLHFVVPKSSDNIPSIVVFCGCSIIMSVLGILLSMITIGIARLDSPFVPAILNFFITGIMSKVLWLGPSKMKAPIDAKLLTSGQVEINSAEDEEHLTGTEIEEDQWRRVAIAFDRIFFFVYCVAFIAILSISFK